MENSRNVQFWGEYKETKGIGIPKEARPKKVAITVGLPPGRFKVAALKKMANQEDEGQREHLKARLTYMNSDIAKVCSNGCTAGLSLGVLYRGKPLIYSNFGHATLERPLKTTENSIYHLAAVGQFMTAYAVGILVKEGKVDWDDPIKLHLGDDFKHYEPSVQGEITVTDCLTHQMGLATQEMLWLAERGRINFGPGQVFDAFSCLEVIDPPNQSWRPNDWGYAIIAKVIEKLSGQTWGEFLQEKIFNPNGLFSTLTQAAEVYPHTATGYMTTTTGESVRNDRPEAGDKTCMAGAHGIQSSVRDMLLFYQYVLEEFKRPAKDRLGPDLDMLTNKHIDLRRRVTLENGSSEQSASMGWIRTELPGILSADARATTVVGKMEKDSPIVWHHTGDYPGYSSASYILPDSQSAVVVLSNSTGKFQTPEMVAQMVIDAILRSEEKGSRPTWWVQKAEDAAKCYDRTWDIMPELLEERKPNSSNPLPYLVDYVGKYYNDSNSWFMEIWYQSPTVDEAEGLWMAMQGNKRRAVQRYPLTHYYKDVFTWLLTNDESAFRGRMPKPVKECYLVKFQLTDDYMVSGLRWDTGDGEQIFTKKLT